MCIPGLHLSLGIFNRLWELLKNSVVDLDISLAECSESDFDEPAFRELLKRKAIVTSEIESQKSYASLLDEMATYHCLTLLNPQTNSFVEELKKEASIALKKKSDMVNN